MRISRFYHSELTIGRVILSEEEAHHARTVLRISAGDAVELFDGAGGVAKGVVAGVSRSEVAVEVAQVSQVPFAGRVQLTLATALPRKQRQGFLFEKCTELGVWAIWPTLFERSVVKPSAGSAEKWRRTVIEACKQCGRLWLPEVTDAMTLSDVLARRAGFDLVLTAGLSDTSVPIVETLRKVGVADQPLRVLLFIGPEGGMADEELQVIGAPLVALAESTLRTETACMAATTIASLHA